MRQGEVAPTGKWQGRAQGGVAAPEPIILPDPRRRFADTAARLVFFQHDEVIVHCPEAMAGAVADAVRSAAAEAGRLVFGPTPVRFPVTTSVVATYADAK